MFVLFYLQLRWFDPSQAGEMRRGRGGGFVSFSEGKETKDRAASFSFAPSASPFPCFSPPPPSPSCSPPRIGIHPYPYLSSPEERKRSGLLCLLLRGRGDGGARGAPLLRVVVVVVPLLLPLPLPLLPPSPSARMCVLLRVPRRVDCYVCFVSSVHPRAFRVASAVPLRRSRNFCRIHGLLVREVDCCVIICDRTSRARTAIFGCSCPHKKPRRSMTGVDP